MSQCTEQCSLLSQEEATVSAAWLAVFSLAVGVFGLLTAEYLPASLLSPMATSLGVSEALAGQSVTVTAIVALFSGLLVPGLTRNMDRRTVLLGFTLLMIASNLLVALSPNLTVLLLMRVLLGIAIGGFWSMVAAVAMRLVPDDQLPRALSVIFSGISVGTVVAVPLGSYLGGIFGWRSTFVAAAMIGIITLLFQFFTLPRMAPRHGVSLKMMFRIALRPGISAGIVGCVLIHGAHFALFTYIRPMLEQTTASGDDALSLILLGFGVANFGGTLLAGVLLARMPVGTLVLMPVVVGVSALALVLLPATLADQVMLVALWGMAFGAIPVAWSNWIARSIPDQAESAGGMVVAAVQSSIAAGAAAGGLMFSHHGITGVFVSAGAVMLIAAVFVRARVRVDLVPPATDSDIT